MVTAIFLAAMLWILISVPAAIAVGTAIRFGSIFHKRQGDQSQ